MLSFLPRFLLQLLNRLTEAADNTSPARAAALLVHLNKTCFGTEDVPGDYKLVKENGKILEKKSLRDKEARKLLLNRNVLITEALPAGDVRDITHAMWDAVVDSASTWNKAEECPALYEDGHECSLVDITGDSRCPKPVREVHEMTWDKCQQRMDVACVCFLVLYGRIFNYWHWCASGHVRDIAKMLQQKYKLPLACMAQQALEGQQGTDISMDASKGQHGGKVGRRRVHQDQNKAFIHRCLRRVARSALEQPAARCRDLRLHGVFALTQKTSKSIIARDRRLALVHSKLPLDLEVVVPSGPKRTRKRTRTPIFEDIDVVDATEQDDAEIMALRSKAKPARKHRKTAA
jgi:hypothetical protein